MTWETVEKSWKMSRLLRRYSGALLKTSTLWYAQLRNPKTLIVSLWMNFKSLQIHESKVTEQFFKWKMSQGMLEEEEEGILREEEAVIVDEEGADHLWIDQSSTASDVENWVITSLSALDRKTRTDSHRRARYYQLKRMLLPVEKSLVGIGLSLKSYFEIRF